MAKVNFNKNLKDFHGKDVISRETGKAESMKDLVCAKLFNAADGLTEDERMKAFFLMLRIAESSDAIEIEDTESVLIKRICEKQFTVGSWGQLVILLNGDKEK